MNDILAIRDTLECPICMEYMLEEISLCVNGHSLCKNCKERLSCCSICRGSFGADRNYTLENIAASLTYPCKNEGCKEELNAKDLKLHDLNCSLGRFTCSTIFNNCTWSGSFSDVNRHIKIDHERYIEKWEQINNLQLYICFYEDKTFFIFFDQSSTMSFYSAVFIGPEEKAKNYILNVEYQDQTDLGYKLSGSSPCIPICTLDKVFNSNKLIFGSEMLNNFSKQGSYAISIITIYYK